MQTYYCKESTKMICIAVILINQTPNWTKFDQVTLERAKTRCGYYYKNSPCLKRFIKVKELQYRAICGKKQ